MAKNEAKLNITSDKNTVVKELQKVQREQEKTIAGLKKMSGESRKSGTAAKQTNQSMISGATTMAARYLSAAAAIGAVTAALRASKAERDRAAETTQTAEFDLGALSQLAGGSDLKFRRLVNAAKTTFREGGSATLGSGAQTVFNLESNDEIEARPFFSQLFGTDDPNAILRATGKIRAAFADVKEETGSSRQLTSKAFAAANPVAGASPSAMLRASTAAADSAAQLGFSDEALFAAVSVAAQKAKSADIGGTQIAALFRVFRREGLVREGESLLQTTRRIKARNLSEPELLDLLKDAEAVTGFAAVASPKFEPQLAAEERANTSDLGGQAIRNRMSLFETALPRRLRAARAETEMDRLVLGAVQQRRDIAKEAVLQESLSEGEEGGYRAVRKAFMDTADFFGARPEDMETASKSMVGLVAKRALGGVADHFSKEGGPKIGQKIDKEIDKIREQMTQTFLSVLRSVLRSVGEITGTGGIDRSKTNKEGPVHVIVETTPEQEQRRVDARLSAVELEVGE